MYDYIYMTTSIVTDVFYVWIQSTSKSIFLATYVSGTIVGPHIFDDISFHIYSDYIQFCLKKRRRLHW